MRAYVTPTRDRKSVPTACSTNELHTVTPYAVSTTTKKSESTILDKNDEKPDLRGFLHKNSTSELKFQPSTSLRGFSTGKKESDQKMESSLLFSKKEDSFSVRGSSFLFLR